MRPETQKTLAVVGASVSSAGLLAWPVGLFVSVFLFDAPGSENNRLLLAFAWSIWLYGPVALVGCVTAFLLVWKKRYGAALVFALAPVLELLVGVALFVAFSVICGGQTRC